MVKFKESRMRCSHMGLVQTSFYQWRDPWSVLRARDRVFHVQLADVICTDEPTLNTYVVYIMNSSRFKELFKVLCFSQPKTLKLMAYRTLSVNASIAWTGHFNQLDDFVSWMTYESMSVEVSSISWVVNWSDKNLKKMCAPRSVSGEQFGKCSAFL